MSNYTEALKEAYALSQSDNPVFETFEISHSSGDTQYLIKNNVDMDLPLVSGGPLFTFKASGLNVKLAPQNKQGIRALDIAISNTELVASDFLKEAIKVANEPVQLNYRIYLLSDLTRPHNDPPLTSYLTAVKITPEQVSGSASFADIINKGFLTELYTLNSNPAL